MLEILDLRRRFVDVVALDGLTLGVAPGEVVDFGAVVWLIQGVSRSSATTSSASARARVA